MTAQLSLFDQPVRQPIVAAVPSPVRSRGPVLRDYQSACVEAVRRELAEAVSTLVVMATGTGKTVTFGEVAATWPTGNVLVLAHRQELIWQAVDKIKRATGREPDVEMAELRASGRGRVVVSSVQTLSSGDRLARFNPHDFGLVVVDECFPSGTVVSGKPIEAIRPGDMVESFDHATGKVAWRQVRQTFRSHVSSLVRVRFASGRELVCTPGHPLFCPHLDSYVPAATIGRGVAVGIVQTPRGRHEAEDVCGVRGNVCAPELERDDDADLFSGVQEGAAGSEAEACDAPVRAVRHYGRVQRSERAGFGATRTGVLLGRMQASGRVGDQLGDDGEDEPRPRGRKDAGAQPHEAGRRPRQGGDATSRDGLGADGSWWQRTRTDATRTGIGRRARMGVERRRADEDAARLGIPVVLQTGCRLSSAEGRHRSRRPLARLYRAAAAGPQEGAILDVDRVERVEVLECRDRGGLGGMRGDGLVHNLHVEGHNNYIVNGVLVHNCHHAPARSYGRILAHFRQNADLRILGVTATPDRHDEAALGRVFATVAYQYELPDAIADGWLVEPRQHFVHVEGLDLSRVRTTAGDLNEGDVAAIIQEDRNLYGIVQPTLEIAGDRPVLFFAPSVEAAKKMADIVNAQRPGQALCIHGGTPTDERRRGLADFERGLHQYLCGCGVFLEGFDSPRIAVVAMARPTKSRALYAQAVGRGTRPIEPPMEGTPDERRASIAFSTKPFLDVIDFVGNAGRHKLVSTADILGGNYEDDVVEAAAAAVKAAGSGEMREALAKAEADKRKREDEARRLALRRAIDAKATYRLEAVDPFDVFDLRAPREPGWHKGRTATDRQRAALVKFGVPEKTAEALSFVKACALMDKMIQRRRDGLCTYKQAKFLRSHGIDGAAVTFERASELFDAIKANGWKKPEGLEP